MINWYFLVRDLLDSFHIGFFRLVLVFPFRSPLRRCLPSLQVPHYLETTPKCSQVHNRSFFLFFHYNVFQNLGWRRQFVPSLRFGYCDLSWKRKRMRRIWDFSRKCLEGTFSPTTQSEHKDCFQHIHLVDIFLFYAVPSLLRISLDFLVLIHCYSPFSVEGMDRITVDRRYAISGPATKRYGISLVGQRNKLLFQFLPIRWNRGFGQ